MTAYISVTDWYVLTILKGFKSNIDTRHLLINGISPEDISILCVNLVSLNHTLGECNKKRVLIFQIARTTLLNQ